VIIVSGKRVFVPFLGKATMNTSTEVTQLLCLWSGGDRAALESLMDVVYPELRHLAHAYLRRERPGHTLQSTALVHEAYLRLIDQKSVTWQNRAHFFGIAAHMMRRILVDHARGRQASKRGAGISLLTLDEAVAGSSPRALDLLALDQALESLARIDPQQSRIVELRFFAGLSIEETAEVQKISSATVKREWAIAKAWLYREMGV
jgi:RNA polymerase sigma factor (TIGR02999 family)